MLALLVDSVLETSTQLDGSAVSLRGGWQLTAHVDGRRLASDNVLAYSVALPLTRQPRYETRPMSEAISDHATSQLANDAKGYHSAPFHPILPSYLPSIRAQRALVPFVKRTCQKAVARSKDSLSRALLSSSFIITSWRTLHLASPSTTSSPTIDSSAAKSLCLKAMLSMASCSTSNCGVSRQGAFLSSLSSLFSLTVYRSRRGRSSPSSFLRLTQTYELISADFIDSEAVIRFDFALPTGLPASFDMASDDGTAVCIAYTLVANVKLKLYPTQEQKRHVRSVSLMSRLISHAGAPLCPSSMRPLRLPVSFPFLPSPLRPIRQSSQQVGRVVSRVKSSSEAGTTLCSRR